MKAKISLFQRVTKAGLWVFALRMLENVLRFARLVIVARLLAPHDFGVFGIALLAMSALETFSQTGFQAALVQKKGDVAPYLNNAWTVSIIRGISLFGILFLGAPYIAFFFNNLEATPVIRVIGASLLVGGFTNSGIVYFQKELEFGKQSLYRLSMTIADFVVVFIAALILRNVWALVYGLLAGSFAGVAASYVIHPYRPHLILDMAKTRELFGFGRWVLGSAVLVFLITQGDDAFVGKFLGVTMLGFYQMAYRISNIPATEITHVISQVTFPAYAKMQDDLSRLREAYVRVLQLTVFLSGPIAGIIFVLAPDFTGIFLGEQWLPMVPTMQVLVLWGFIRSVGATTGPIFSAIGKPEISTKLQFLLLILLGIIIYPFSMTWGIFGTSLAVLLATLVPNAVALYNVERTLQCKTSNFGRIIIFPVINTCLLILFVRLLTNCWKSINAGNVLLSVILSLILYCCLIYVSDKIFKYNFLSNVKKSFYSFKAS
jgi:O-antigen/teichoic acid export membrane protein